MEPRSRGFRAREFCTMVVCLSGHADGTYFKRLSVEVG